jgi:hypothetical protein
VDEGAVSGLRFELGTREKDGGEGTYLTRTYTRSQISEEPIKR